MTNEEKINLIGQKILILSNNLDNYQAELQSLKAQLETLQQDKAAPVIPETPVPPAETRQPVHPHAQTVISTESTIAAPPVNPVQQPVQPEAQPAAEFNFEEFIGGKLISIIGIVVLIIGLGIGVKYAIDRDLINPLTRILLAYAAGGILLFIAFRLRHKFKTFSAVLLSGAMASLYFTTFIGYSMYSLFPQLAAFAIMLVFTVFTVFAATVYSLEVIGIIGLAGAYAVPMLLSDGSGNIRVMFAYMLIINAGILVLSFKRYWQILNHVAFGITWMIAGGWMIAKYDPSIHAAMLLGFSFAFFLIFYISNMAYKIVKQEKFGLIDIIRLLSNSFIFFGIGYGALNNPLYKDYLGLFTVANALVHFIFSVIVYRNKLLDRQLFYLLIAMVLTFITIAVPVQLEGSWVTLIWSTEAALLFITGRYRHVRFYEWIGLVLLLLAVFSLLGDWTGSYFNTDNIAATWTPLSSIYFLTSVYFLASIGAILYVHRKKALGVAEENKFSIYPLISIALPVLLAVFIYLTLYNEISTYFSIAMQRSETGSTGAAGNPDYSLMYYKGTALCIYNFAFLSACTGFSLKRWNDHTLRWTVFSLGFFYMLLFLFTGFSDLAELRTLYLDPGQAQRYSVSSWAIYIRYACFLLLALLLYLLRLLLKTEAFAATSLSKIYNGCIIHFFILTVLSAELININILHNYSSEYPYYNYTQTAYKLGFTCLWGIYSFFMIAWGIFRRNRIMRVSAIFLFGITLFKLVTFDTWDLSTGYKVIAFILLGVILLVVAFLYQKFKVLIFGSDEPEENIKSDRA